MAHFKPGDTVRLRSGGPLMTVQLISSDGEVWCEWFDTKQEAQSRGIKATSLESDDGTPTIG
jgi:uncharacterized protein YodC (DUF2158 family)